MKTDHFQEHVGAGERGIPKDSLKAPIAVAAAKGVYTRLDDSDFTDLAIKADEAARNALNPFEKSCWEGRAAELRAIARGVREPNPEPVVLEWVEANCFRADGKPLPACGKGMTLAWLAMAQYVGGDEPLHLEALGMSAAAVGNAIKRAQRAAKPVNAALAASIGCIGTHRGRLIVKRALDAPIDLRAPVLVRACRGA